MCLPEANLISAKDVSLDEAAMVEFLAIGAHAVSRAAPSRKDRVLVVGAGPIGIGCAIFAGLSGGSVTVADTRRDRLDFCVAQLGVEHIVEPGADVIETMSKLTSGDFYDVVIDATGKRPGDDGRPRLCGSRRRLRPCQRRARHDRFRGSRSFTSAKPRSWAAATQRARTSRP